MIVPSMNMCVKSKFSNMQYHPRKVHVLDIWKIGWISMIPLLIIPANGMMWHWLYA